LAEPGLEWNTTVLNITCGCKVSYLLFCFSTEKFLHLIDLAAVCWESLASLDIEFLELQLRVVYRGVEEFPFLFLQIRNNSRSQTSVDKAIILKSSSSSSSSSIVHGVGPLVDPFRSHVSRSLFKGLS
jgi:hypothetical protein